MRRLATRDVGFKQQLEQLLTVDTVTDPALVHTVDTLIRQVRQEGDAAVLALTQRFDQHPAQSMSDLEISAAQCQQAYDTLDPAVRDALTAAAARIRRFHQQQVAQAWRYTDEYGNTLGQQVTPLDRVGIYVPGGKASYPSSVLMNALPAHVAGVPEIIMVAPAPQGELNQLVLAAAHLAGVSRFFTIGGAQAVAALAYGTETIPRVDKITGPGNRYVAAAKRAVFGQVGIDMIAGPSEILVYAENGDHGLAGTVYADWLAMDLLSQAEHDEVAQSILITTDAALLEQIAEAVTRQLDSLPRRDIASASVRNRGALILADSQAEVLALINRIAPEHLQLCVDDPDSLLPHIRHAGAIFMGRHTPEAIGDYCAGPNHVLPTSGTARFSSPLGVYDFQKRSSVIHCTVQGSAPLARMADILAVEEGLEAHARSARYRAEQS